MFALTLFFEKLEKIGNTRRGLTYDIIYAYNQFVNCHHTLPLTSYHCIATCVNTDLLPKIF